MDILSHLFEFGQRLTFKGIKYIGLNTVGQSKKDTFWLAVKEDDKDPAKVYLIPVKPVKLVKESHVKK